MDFENHRFSYLSTNGQPLKNIENQICSFLKRISTVLRSLDSPLPSFLFSTFPKQNQKTHTCANTCISENISIVIKIATIRPLKITSKIHTLFFTCYNKTSLKINKKSKKNLASLKHHYYHPNINILTSQDRPNDDHRAR